jgi:hypothetical protein
VGGPGVSASSSSGSANALSSGTISGTTSVTGPFLYTVDTITLAANAGPMDVTKPWSYVTFSANVTGLTPSGYASANTTHVLHCKNSDGSNSHTVVIANSGTNYTVTVAAGSDAWYTLVSNGSNAWVPLALDPAANSVDPTSRVMYQNPTTGVYFYDTVTHDLSTAAPSVNLGSLTGTININWSLGNNFYGTLTGSTVFTFSNVVDGKNIVVKVAQTGTNSYTVTWPSTKWHSGTPPTMTSGSATEDVTTIINYGGTYYGNSVQDLH